MLHQSTAEAVRDPRNMTAAMPPPQYPVVQKLLSSGRMQTRYFACCSGGLKCNRLKLVSVGAFWLSRSRVSLTGVVLCCVRRMLFVPCVNLARGHKAKSPASGSVMPCIWRDTNCAASMLKVMPLPPKPKTAKQRGKPFTRPIAGNPFGLSPKLPVHE